MARIFNFSAGPSALPQEVLEQAQAELLDYQSTGMSVMEMSHRSDVFVGIASRAEADFRDLLGVSDNYHVLFLQGGATTQFASIPLNLTQVGDTVDYLDTGAWSSKAVKEAAKYCHVNVVASGKSGNYSSIPDVAQWRHGNNARYLHICSNETTGGVQFKQFPNVSVPLVADMSSDFLSRPVDVDRFAVIYGGAQKNIGPAGLTLVVVRKDLCGSARVETPGTLDFAVQAGADSMSNTPPTFAWYLAGLVFEWLKNLGGLPGINEINERKAAKLYDTIDASDFYQSPVEASVRSTMNVPFTMPKPELDKLFVSGAEAIGLSGLKGHRSVGGMRASLYNAVPEAAVDALISFMNEFEHEHG